jgi:membrane protease YdiL (CAAX protease family)
MIEPLADENVVSAVSDPDSNPRFGLLDVVVVLGLFVFVEILASGLALGVARYIPVFHGQTWPELFKSPFFIVPVQFLAYVATFLLTRMYITLRAETDFWEAVSWNFPDLFDGMKLAFLGMALAISSQVAEHFMPIPKNLPIEEYFSVPGAAPLLLAFAVLVAPFMEELFFRGLFFPALRVKAGAIAAALFTSFLFALLHAGQLARAVGPLAVLFTVGLVLTGVRHRMKSLGASWLVHFCYNGTLFLMMTIATRGFRNMQ